VTDRLKDELEIIPKVDKKYDAAVSGTVHELTIHDVSTDDQAEYTLEVGDESTTALLKVDGNKRPPRQSTSRPRDSLLRVNCSHVITCYKSASLRK